MNLTFQRFRGLRIRHRFALLLLCFVVSLYVGLWILDLNSTHAATHELDLNSTLAVTQELEKPKVVPQRTFNDWVKLKPEMDDPDWVEYVRKNYLVPPNSKPYNLSANVAKDPSDGQLKAVLDILPSSGFFIECGAADGELLSNTLFLEKELGWSGLLIEAEPTYFSKLVTKNRKAWLSPLCLSLEGYPGMGKFYRHPQHPFYNGLTLKQSTSLEMACIPLYTLLLAVNRTLIDFFSFDVEASELDIMKWIPFDKVIFKVITIEVRSNDHKRLKDFMASKGYIYYKKFVASSSHDFLFIYGGGGNLTSTPPPPSSQSG